MPKYPDYFARKHYICRNKCILTNPLYSDYGKAYLVKPFGIEGGDILTSEDYIIEDTENEAIMRKDDKHLLFYVSIAKIGNNLIDVTTVVQYHNALGKVYFFFIKPFHKMIVPRVVKEFI